MSWILEQASISSGMLTYVAITLLVLYISVWFVRRRRKVWMLDKIPGPKGLPILGNTLDLNLESRELFEKLNSFAEYGEVVKIWIGAKPYVFLNGVRGIETVLSSSKFLDKSYDYTFTHPWLGTGLLTSTGSKWHSRRKLLTPAFHFKILEDFVEVFNTQSIKLVKILKDNVNGKPINIFPYITRCTLDIICETAMGTSVHAQDDIHNPYVDSIYKMGYMVQQRTAKAWQRPHLLYWLLGYAKERDACIKILHDFTLKTIRERKRVYKEPRENKEANKDDDSFGTKKRRLAFLDLLLEYSQNGSNLSDNDIREEVDTFMFEGHDTTTAAINWSLFLLGLHPDEQAKVHEELDSIFGDSDRPVTSEDLKELRYLDLCIKEALRIFPSVPFIGRELKKDEVIDNFHVPEGTSITIMIYQLHRDPKIYENPEEFKPERFLPENSKGRHPFAYLPFSAGLRNCIGQKFAGMEEKIVLSNILRNFRVESHETRKEVKVLGELILRPEEGNKVKLFPRKARSTPEE